MCPRCKDATTRPRRRRAGVVYHNTTTAITWAYTCATCGHTWEVAEDDEHAGAASLRRAQIKEQGA